MILEVADIRIHPGTNAAFEAAAKLGLDTVFPRARGFRGYEVKSSIESGDRYLLLLRWDTLEDHTVGFRTSPLHGEWRALVGSFFAQPPFVQHFHTCAASGHE